MMRPAKKPAAIPIRSQTINPQSGIFTLPFFQTIANEASKGKDISAGSETIGGLTLRDEPSMHDQEKALGSIGKAIAGESTSSLALSRLTALLVFVFQNLVSVVGVDPVRLFRVFCL